jgi:hypothetical protein
VESFLRRHRVVGVSVSGGGVRRGTLGGLVPRT